MTGRATAQPKQAWLRLYRKTFLILGLPVDINMPGLMIEIIMSLLLGGPIRLTFFIGTGRATHHRAAPFRSLYKMADSHFYHAKQHGRDCLALPRAA